MTRRKQRPEPEAIGDWPDCETCGSDLDNPDLTLSEAWESHDSDEPVMCSSCLTTKGQE